MTDLQTRRKGITVAGGAGTHLHPATAAISRQKFPVHDKPMIYHLLNTLMPLDIRGILLFSTPQDTPSFQQLLGDGSASGLLITYSAQPNAGGLAQAFLFGEETVGTDPCALILGDKVFHGSGQIPKFNQANGRTTGATVFAYRVIDPERFGVVAFGADDKTISIEEKSAKSKSRLAFTGLHFHDNQGVNVVRAIRPSGRGELEILDMDRVCLQRGDLSVEVFGREVVWLNIGTHEGLSEALSFVETLVKWQRLKIACPEGIGFRLGYIDPTKLSELPATLGRSDHGPYLSGIPPELETT